MTSEEFFVSTRRPIVGPIAEALNSELPAKSLADVVASELDSSEGWVWTTEDAQFWLAGRLAVEIQADDNVDVPSVSLRILATRGAQLTDELLEWLNVLNTHAAGWNWYCVAETGEVVCVMRAAALVKEWWWPSMLSQVATRAVTVAESMADLLAEFGAGEVAIAKHPLKGLREKCDGWIAATRLGPRDLAAALPPALLDNELDRLHRSVLTFRAPKPEIVAWPFSATMKFEDLGTVLVRQHWHCDFGWGWQFVAVPWVSSGDPEVAAWATNALNAHFNAPGTQLGGWIRSADLGIIHVAFIPGREIDRLFFISSATAGDMTAVMLDLPTRVQLLQLAHTSLADLPDFQRLQPKDELHLWLSRLEFDSGPVGFSYISLADATEVEEEERAESDWLIPKHWTVCAWGIFNPMGPTMGSLEVTVRASQDEEFAFDLWHVMRHPHSPSVTLVGSCNDHKSLDAMITDRLGCGEPDTFDDPRILVSPPEWIEIFSHRDAVVTGFRKFGTEVAKNDDLRSKANRLVHFAWSPWARVSDSESSVESRFSPEMADVDCWLAAATDEMVVLGHKLFMRSAWEGSLAYMKSLDPDEAQAAVRVTSKSADDRLEALMEWVSGSEDEPRSG